MTATFRSDTTPSARYCLLAAIAMAYGWGYRGTVGHEQGAMVPGALLGLVLCLGSGRLDWHRRTAVVGLFAAAGWAWGGSISYMEQTFYVFSDSFPDVLYGYTMLLLIGALWAGCGGAVLGIGLTESRSELECLIRPLFALGVVLLLVYLYFVAMPEHNEAYETFTVLHFHDGDWLSATLTLLVSAIYWIARPRDRRGAALFFWAAVAWWVGYGLLTKFGGLRLAPLHRSESWGGVLGVLVALIVYLVRRENRAALMLCLYGCVGGGLAFALAVMIHHPVALHWGPLAGFSIHLPAWRIAEVSFGFFMGLALALGTNRLLRGGLAPPTEDTDRTASDTFSVFVIAVGLLWMNFRRHTDRVLARSPATDENALLGLPTGAWYFLVAALVSIPACYALYRYSKGDRLLVPQSAFGKGVAVTLFLVWATAGAQLLDAHPSRTSIVANLSSWLLAALATCLLISFTSSAARAVEVQGKGVSRTDGRWRVGRRFALVCASAPFFLLCFTGLSMSMQDGPHGSRGRLRFGPSAYWQQTARLQGSWKAVGRSKSLGDIDVPADDLPLTQLDFDTYRNAIATLPTGERSSEHRWFLKNQYIWLQWHGKTVDHPERAEVPLQFHERRLYIAWPPHTRDAGYLVFERIE